MSDNNTDYPNSRYATDEWGHKMYVFLNETDAPPNDTCYDWEQIGFDESRQRRVWKRIAKEEAGK
mgnify:CR=1 FL=1